LYEPTSAARAGSCATTGLAAAAAGLTLLLASPAPEAAPPPISVPISSEDSGNPAPNDFAGFLASLKRSNYLLGDLFGLRTALSRYGMSFAVQETSEVLGNATGGIQRGAEYEGLTQAVLQLDTQRAFGHYGGLFNVSMLQVHGQNLSALNLGTLQTASGIEADRSTRLWELWYDQKLLEEDRLDVKVGQISADQEFIVSANALYFVNTMFGWPALPSYDLPGGGPAYPLSAPAVRLRLRPVNAINLLVGVFSGSPVNDPTGDPQQRNASGTSFPFHQGLLLFTELQYAYPSLGSMVYPGESAPLGRTYRLGAWYDSSRFTDPRYDLGGIPLASPASSGVPANHRGDYSIYAVADQMLWRNPIDPNNTLSGFTRVMGAPQSDRNLISVSLNAGLVYHEPFRYRSDDTLGIGLGYVHVSSAISGYDRDVAAYTALANPGGLGAATSLSPVRSSETYLEATYQYQVRPWLQLQPDLQYVFRPGAGVVDPNVPTQRLQNEFVLGVRANILF
jgi:porin